MGIINYSDITFDNLLFQCTSTSIFFSAELNANFMLTRPKNQLLIN